MSLHRLVHYSRAYFFTYCYIFFVSVFKARLMRANVNLFLFLYWYPEMESWNVVASEKLQNVVIWKLRIDLLTYFDNM